MTADPATIRQAIAAERLRIAVQLVTSARADTAPMTRELRDAYDTAQRALGKLQQAVSP